MTRGVSDPSLDARAEISRTPKESIGKQILSERFSTTGFSERERVEKWEDHNAKALLALGARTLNDVSLEATEVNLHLPNLHFAHVTANAHVIERTAERIRSTPADSVVLYFALSGDAFFYHKDGVRTLSPGSVLVYETDKPFMRGFAKGLEELVLMVPRNKFIEIAEGGLPVGGEPQVLSFGKSNNANRFASEIAEVMSRALANPEEEQLSKVEDTVFDLLRGIFAGDSAPDSSAQYKSLLAFIDRHLRNPGLSAFMICKTFGMSARQLSRIFAANNNSLPRVILKKRLHLAKRVLISAGSDQMFVANVASYCGFNSHAHFSRAFKETFGVSPSEVRRLEPSSSEPV